MLLIAPPVDRYCYYKLRSVTCCPTFPGEWRAFVQLRFQQFLCIILFNWLTDIYDQVQQLSNWVEELRLETQKLDDDIQGLEDRIQELEDKDQEMDHQLHEQKERIDSLEREVCELNDKFYRPDLRGMLNLFRTKVYLILFYSISNTLIFFLLLHVVGSDTVKKKKFGLPGWLAHQLF